MHPIEHAIYFSPIMLLWLIPATPVHYEYLMLLTGLGASLGHIGFSKLKIKTVALDIDDYAHFLHHKYVTINFGSTVAGLPLDRWLGTFYDGSGDLRSRTKRSEKGQAEDGSRKCKSVSRNE
jgi:sterol desaturase/sphingolipid hydroxylase (fatty acid hydroxylase superfamily)